MEGFKAKGSSSKGNTSSMINKTRSKTTSGYGLEFKQISNEPDNYTCNLSHVNKEDRNNQVLYVINYIYGSKLPNITYVNKDDKLIVTFTNSNSTTQFTSQSDNTTQFTSQSNSTTKFNGNTSNILLNMTYSIVEFHFKTTNKKEEIDRLLSLNDETDITFILVIVSIIGLIGIVSVLYYLYTNGKLDNIIKKMKNLTN